MPNEHPVCMSFGDCTHPQHQETTNVCHDTSMQRRFFWFEQGALSITLAIDFLSDDVIKLNNN